jgi:L-amino acid N-acyltransferase YncA
MPVGPPPPPTLVIRDATTDDAAACAAIYAPYVHGTPITFETVAPSAPEVADRIRAAASAHAWFVGERAGEVVGYASAGPFAARAAYRWSCEVTVYCAPEVRRTGAGRALYAALLHRLTERGYHTAVAKITMPNEPSLGLHRAFGFEPAGVLRRIGFKLGEWHDVALCQRTLAGATAGGPPPDPH